MSFRSPVTLIVILINVLVFALIAWQQKSLMMNTSADALAVLNAGANLNPFTLGGQPWRIFTAMFLHFGIIHMAVNMFALWQLGSLLEPAIGRTRFSILYLICGLVASISSLLFNVFVISAGASGAIFGLYGYQLGAELVSSYHDWNKLKPVLFNFAIFAVVNTFIAGQVNVDMSGHIGGALAGLVIAACHFKLGILKNIYAMSLVLIILPFTLFFLPKDQVNYYHIFQRVLNQERYYDKLMREVKTESLLADSLQKVHAGWQSINHDLKNLSHVSAAMKEDTATLGRYISLRARDVNYRHRILKQSYIYLDSLEVLRAQFDSLPSFRHHPNYTVVKEPAAEEDSTMGTDQGPKLNAVKALYDKDWKETVDTDNMHYYRLGSNDSLGRWQGAVRDYFANGNIQMKGTYADDLRDGVFIYYTDRGTYTSAGRYEKELPVGKWEHFHWNGSLQSEVFHNQRSFTKTVWDSLGNIQVADGNGDYKRWYANGVLAEEGTYYKGARTGNWLGYHENGKPYYKEFYQNNMLVNGISEGKDGKRYMYDASSLFPTPVDGFAKYRVYLEKNARKCGDNGIVKVLFNAGKDGALWDFVILEGLSPACDAEAIRLIREGPSWRAALLHGAEKIQSQGYVEVKF